MNQLKSLAMHDCPNYNTLCISPKHIHNSYVASYMHDIYTYIYVTLSYLGSKKTESICITCYHVAHLPLTENALMRNGGCI